MKDIVFCIMSDILGADPYETFLVNEIDSIDDELEATSRNSIKRIKLEARKKALIDAKEFYLQSKNKC